MSCAALLYPAGESRRSRHPLQSPEDHPDQMAFEAAKGLLVGLAYLAKKRAEGACRRMHAGLGSARRAEDARAGGWT